VTLGLEGKTLVEVADLADAGVVAFSDDGKPVANAKLMRHALEYSLLTGQPIVNHCEDPELAHAGYMNEGLTSLRLGLRGIPREAEEAMVARDLLLAERTGAHVHIAHVSTKGSVHLIRAARARGVHVTAEVTPHHLTLTDDIVGGVWWSATAQLPPYDTRTKVNPPLRTQEDIDALIAGLNDDTIDAIATDHAPHAAVDKLCEYGQAAFGISCLETAASQVYGLVRAGKLSLETFVRKLTWGPACVFGLNAGRLDEGAPADITLLDPNREWVVDPARFASKGKNTPIAGTFLYGQVLMTFVGGACVYRLAD